MVSVKADILVLDQYPAACSGVIGLGILVVRIENDDSIFYEKFEELLR